MFIKLLVSALAFYGPGMVETVLVRFERGILLNLDFELVEWVKFVYKDQLLYKIFKKNKIKNKNIFLGVVLSRGNP